VDDSGNRKRAATLSLSLQLHARYRLPVDRAAYANCLATTGNFPPPQKSAANKARLLALPANQQPPYSPSSSEANSQSYQSSTKVLAVINICDSREKFPCRAGGKCSAIAEHVFAAVKLVPRLGCFCFTRDRSSRAIEDAALSRGQGGGSPREAQRSKRTGEPD